MKELKFPIWLYHKEKKPEGLICHSQEEYEKLGKGWVESPALFEEKEKSDKTPVGATSDHPEGGQDGEAVEVKSEDKPKKGKK